MELPKNTTQMGEVGGSHRVFIEDYVISYIKQICRQEPDHKKRVALYGSKKQEDNLQYFFVYAGAEIPMHSRSDSYLNEQDYEEVTWMAASFDPYLPLGFVTIEDELPEGIYLTIAGKSQFVKGYHIFYEKNESMLAFMIQKQAEQEKNREKARQTENRPDIEKKADSPGPEPMNNTPYREQLKKEEKEPEGLKLTGILKSAAAALFIVLCVTAISTMNGLGKIEDLQNFFQKALQAMTEKKLPDIEENIEIPVSAEAVPETNNTMKEKQEAVLPPETPQQEIQLEESQSEATPDSSREEGQPQVPQKETLPEEDLTARMEAENQVVKPEPRIHTIQSGETLIAISKNYYGDEGRVKEICELNKISNPDNIQIGQKIILPE